MPAALSGAPRRRVSERLFASTLSHSFIFFNFYAPHPTPFPSLSNGGAQSRHQGGRYDGRDAAGRGRRRGPGERRGPSSVAPSAQCAPFWKERHTRLAGGPFGGAHVIVLTLPGEPRELQLEPGLPWRSHEVVRPPPSHGRKKERGWPALSPPAARRTSLLSPRVRSVSHTRPSTSTPSKKTSPPLSRRNLTRSTRRPGTAWWGATLVRRERRAEVTRSAEDERVTASWASIHSIHPSIHPPISPSFLPCSTGSYVTHETKHFIYFYIGMNERARREAGERETHPPNLHALTHPLSFSLPSHPISGQYAVLLFKSG